MRLLHALSRLGRFSLTVGTAAVLTTGLTTNAQAATGTIRYFGTNGQEFRILNPADDVCVNLQIRPDLITNDTDKTVSVYFNGNCSTFVTDLLPGQAVAHIGGPRSVRVIG